MNRFNVIDTETGKEADTFIIAMCEGWAKRLCYGGIDGFALTQDGTLILMDEFGKYAYCPKGRFEVVFDDEL